MTMASQTDLLNPNAPAVPQLKAWYPVCFRSWDYITSPTRGSMRRLIGEILRGPCSGIVVWKPLTNTFEGCRWVERALKAVGFPERKLASLRRPGLGEYLDNLCRALVEHGQMLAVLYPFDHATGRYWTVDRVKKIA